jgi:hypothetical protein
MAAQAPPPAVIARFRLPIARLAQWYIAARRQYPGVRLTSWWRSRERNAAVGGQPTSQHLVGCAIDVVGVPLAQAQRLAAQYGLTAIASQRGAVHVQALPAGTVARLLRAEPELLS